MTATEDQTHWFAPILSSDFEATTVTADATAVWGGIGSTTSIPLIFSACVIQNSIQAGGSSFVFQNGRYELTTSPSAVVTINAVTNGNGNVDAISQECALQGSGHFDPTPPGGFGVITDSGVSTCDVPTTVDQPVSGDQGANLSQTCTYEQLVAVVDAAEPIPIPVHNGFAGTGSNATYHVYGHVGFRLTGFGLNLGGSARTYGNATCSGAGNNNQCLTGQFMNLVDADAELDPSAPDLGSFTFKLID
ncbi:hypothetical protein [Georgenia sp. SUBG003]|uniref:hypothetical protein n=1 Tax=Georgenia sp. SUBG003 TaxID=1497974 RepID=UPI003AB915EC